MIDRCESLDVRVLGIEAFTADAEPPSKLQMVGIKISSEDGGYDWARRLVQEYMESRQITNCATFDLPDALLKSDPKQEGKPNR